MTSMSRIVALGLCAASAIAIGAAGPVSAQAAKGKKTIVAPKSGKAYPAKPLSVRVDIGKNAVVFRAQMNGRSIARHFRGMSKRGVTRLRVTPTLGLRHGSNRLHVRVKSAGGRKRSAWAHFRIRRNRPLAAPGVRRKVNANAGHTLGFDGKRSRSHLRGSTKRAGGRSRLDHHWRIVRSPKTPRSDAADAPSLSGADTPTPTLETTDPGLYKVQLTVEAGDGTKGVANVAINALNPPLLHVDTMPERSGGSPGIKVGNTTYSPDAGTAATPPWWQVVVLSRKTLTPVSGPLGNKTYLCHRATNGFCSDDELQQDLATLNSSNLVIAANHLSNPSWAAPGYLSFQKIGVPAVRSQDLPSGASFSAIGVPGDSPGEANWRIDPAGGAGGQVTGSLIIDNIGNYTYLAPRVTFDTQVFGSNDQQNVMRVGTQTYTAPIQLDGNQNGQGGFHVLVLDKGTLQGESHWFGTGHQDFDSGEPGRLDAMTATLRQANENGNKLVIVASRGNPVAQAAGREDQQPNVNSAAQRLVDQLEALGGTRTAAFQALAPPPATKSGASYTLIGHSRAGTAHGVEVQGSTSPPRGLNTAALRGSFMRGHDSGFEVADTSPSQIQNPSDPPQHMPADRLNEVLVQAPQPWPGQDDPHQRDAIAYIGQKQFSGDDIRTDYWTSGKDDNFWRQKRTDVGTVSHPGGNPNFNPTELETAKAQIQQEITWLLAVRGFTRDLSKPFAKAGLQSWADLNAIANTVNSSVQPPAQNKATMIAGAIFDGAREIATEIPVIGEGIGVVNSIYDTALEIAKIAGENGEPADEPFSVVAADFGAHLVTRLNTAQDTLTGEMTNAIVADYGKLKTVGACYLLDTTNCPDNPTAWKFDGTDQTSASKALRVGSEVESYGAMVPARWTLWQLGTECYGAFNRTCWETDFQGDGFFGQVGLVNQPICPFLTAQPSTKLIRPLYRDIPHYRNDHLNPGDPSDVWLTYTLGNLSGGGTLTNVYKMELPGDFLGHVFAAPDPGGDISKGGLGAQREEFFLGNMTPKLMSRAQDGGQPFPYNDSFPLWHGRNTDCTATP